MSDPSSIMVSMVNRLSTEQRARIVGCLVEGNSIRATVRLTGAAKNTIVKLLLDLGIACSDYQDRALRNLTCQRVQVDEIWSFRRSQEGERQARAQRRLRRRVDLRVHRRGHQARAVVVRRPA